jgi:hypothetical protein
MGRNDCGAWESAAFVGQPWRAYRDLDLVEEFKLLLGVVEVALQNISIGKCKPSEYPQSTLRVPSRVPAELLGAHVCVRSRTSTQERARARTHPRTPAQCVAPDRGGALRVAAPRPARVHAACLCVLPGESARGSRRGARRGCPRPAAWPPYTRTAHPADRPSAAAGTHAPSRTCLSVLAAHIALTVLTQGTHGAHALPPLGRIASR